MNIPPEYFRQYLTIENIKYRVNVDRTGQVERIWLEVQPEPHSMGTLYTYSLGRGWAPTTKSTRYVDIKILNIIQTWFHCYCGLTLQQFADKCLN